MGETFRWYMNYKISSIKWYNSLSFTSKKLGYFASGSWDQENNQIVLHSLELPTEDEPVTDPIAISSIRHSGDVTDLNWIYYTSSPHLVSSSSNGSVNLFRIPLSDDEVQDANLQITQEKSWKIHSGPCTAISVHQDSQHIASVGEDGKIAVFTVTDTLPSRVLENAESFAITDAQFVTSNVLASVTSNGAIKFWDTRVQASNTPVIAIQDTIEHSYLRAISVHPTQPDYLAVGSSDGTLSVWDVRSTKAPKSRFRPETSSTTRVMFHAATPSFIFSSYMNGTVLLWDFNASRDIAMGSFQVEEDNSRLYGVVTEPLSVNDLDLNVELKALICGSDEGSVVVKTGIE